MTDKEQRNGSPLFYKLLEKMAEIHHKKSHDYASNDNPFGNYTFSGKLSKLFDNSDDAGFVARIGEKLYRLANLENSGKVALNETIEDTEDDICTIMVLWMVQRRGRRDSRKMLVSDLRKKMDDATKGFTDVVSESAIGHSNGYLIATQLPEICTYCNTFTYIDDKIAHYVQVHGSMWSKAQRILELPSHGKFLIAPTIPHKPSTIGIIKDIEPPKGY